MSSEKVLIAAHERYMKEHGRKVWHMQSSIVTEKQDETDNENKPKKQQDSFNKVGKAQRKKPCTPQCLRRKQMA